MTSLVSAPQRSALKESLAIIVPNASQLSETFYWRLFELDPSTRSLFKHGMDAQRRRFVEMIVWIVEHLDRESELFAAVADLGRRHKRYGVEADHYAVAGSALVYSFSHTLGSAFTPDMEEAWIDLYAAMGRVMEDAAEHG